MHAADNEIERRRLINANRVSVFGADSTRVLALICECGTAECHESVLLTSADYELRKGSGDLVVHAKHGVPV